MLHSIMKFKVYAVTVCAGSQAQLHCNLSHR